VRAFVLDVSLLSQEIEPMPCGVGRYPVSLNNCPDGVPRRDEVSRHQQFGGELISLPAQEQSAMVNALASVGEDVSATKPELHSAYHIISEAAQRTR
jgi:hypothetical protein